MADPCTFLTGWISLFDPRTFFSSLISFFFFFFNPCRFFTGSISSIFFRHHLPLLRLMFGRMHRAK